jgi:hypothetical protein
MVILLAATSSTMLSLVVFPLTGRVASREKGGSDSCKKLIETKSEGREPKRYNQQQSKLRFYYLL